MKYYDFDKAKKLIEDHRDSLNEANLGMYEDWFWTAERIFKCGAFDRDLPDNKTALEKHGNYLEKRRGGMSLFIEESKSFNDIMIGGIYGSDWATPTIQLQFLDGTDKMIPCFITDSEKEKPFGEQKAEIAHKQSLLLGCLSGPAQDNITPLSNE